MLNGKHSLHRLLVSATLLMALLTSLLAGLLLAFDLQSALERRRQVYEALLDTFTGVYLQEQLERDRALLGALSAQLEESGESGLALSPSWPVLVRALKAGGEHAYFYNARTDHIDAYPAWTRPAGFVAAERPWAVLLDPAVRDETTWVGPYSEFSSHQPMMTAVRRVRGADGALRGLLMVDLAISPLERALERVVGTTPATLTIFNRDGRVVAAANPLRTPIGAASLRRAATSADLVQALRYGVLVYRQLPSPAWDVVLYTPAAEVRRELLEAAPRYLVGLFGLLALWLVGFSLFKRIFVREQALLSSAMAALSQGAMPAEPLPRRARTWFVGEQLGVIQRVARELDDAKRASQQDVLTGLANRRAFDADFARRWQAGAPFWLLAIDIDHFKQLNDRYGHLFGDTVLQRLGAALQEGETALALYRTGGDELMALADGSADIAALLDRMFARVCALQWRERELVVSVSVGAAASGETADAEALLQLADARLYQSKHAGRGRATWLAAAQPA
ncbi:GGDEF domain-containing protein [Crenobacter caeni]|uniref:diguanylate cyclase n=1 Tax=Crenobacter caeni TaxID=2705474 RepID=A0A6B2KTB4_9NEIS|nr:sensor domain-containing diguanylate cyclase [Crenobacter caeni]NDV13486.1 diguanylate cyclase [Crenobacter caeni]